MSTYSAMKTPDLKALCKTRDLKGYSSMVKASLVKYLETEDRKVAEAAAPAPKAGSVKDLKARCKAASIKGTSGLGKADLAATLKAGVKTVNIPNVNYDDMTVVQLKAVCQANKVKYAGFSKHGRKADLVAFIREQNAKSIAA